MENKDVLLVCIFVCVFAFGFFTGKAYERAQVRAMVRYRCCDHCYDPTSGERLHPYEDDHTVECNEVGCTVGRERVL